MNAFLRVFRAGLEETAERSADLLGWLARRIGWLLGRLLWLVLWAIEFPILVVQGFWIVVTETARLALRVSERLSARLHPAVAVGLVIAGAAALLAASQFSDYRAEAVGDYTPAGLAEVGVDPPLSDRRTPVDAHSVALLAIAAGAILILAAAALGRRWRLGRVVSLLGLAAVAVVLAVDLREGLEPGAEAIAYADSSASLLGAFWVELSAAATLALCGLLLSAYMRPHAEQYERRRNERRRRAGERHTRLAEGRV
jgi:hypothetical protein